MQCGWCKRGKLEKVNSSRLDENGKPSLSGSWELEGHMVPGTVARECKGFQTYMSLENLGRVVRVD